MEYFLLTTNMHTAAKTTKSLYGRLNDLGVSVKNNWVCKIGLRAVESCLCATRWSIVLSVSIRVGVRVNVLKQWPSPPPWPGWLIQKPVNASIHIFPWWGLSLEAPDSITSMLWGVPLHISFPDSLAGQDEHLICLGSFRLNQEVRSFQNSSFFQI